MHKETACVISSDLLAFNSIFQNFKTVRKNIGNSQRDI